jgi:hypothetical protein
MPKPTSIQHRQRILSTKQDNTTRLLYIPAHGWSHVFQPQYIRNRVHTPLGFNYDKNIDGSIATLAESCNLINIHKLKHDNVPATYNAGSDQIDFIYL